MTFEAIGLLHYNDHSEVKAKPFSDVDPDFIRDCARAHDESGFDRVLIANSAHRPDSLPVACWAAAATTNLKFMIAHRPGFIAPTMAARMFAMLDRMSGGRCGVHIITGADDVEMQADGDFLTKEERYQRSHEYVRVMRQVWAAEAPFDHEGTYYRVNGAFAHVRPRPADGIPIFWGGTSAPAVSLGAEVADIFALPGFGLERIGALTGQVRAAADRLGRRPDFLVSLKVIVESTEARAWERAHDLLRQLVEEVHDNGRMVPNPGETRAQAIARVIASMCEGSLDGRLWTALTKVPIGRPTINCLVGSTDQIVATLMDYHALGVSRFILSGHDPIADAIHMGSDLIPRLREAVAAAG